MFNRRVFSKYNLNFKNILKFMLLPIGYKLNIYNQINHKSYCQDSNTQFYDHLDEIEKRLNNLIETRKGVREVMKEYPNFHNNKLLMQLVTTNLYKKYKNIKTKEGYTIEDIIQPGIDNPNSKYTLIAPSQDAYMKFSEIFENYLKHNFPEDLKKPFENESYSMIKSLVAGMEEIMKEYFAEIDITTHRNLNNFSFTSKIKRKERSEVKEILKNAIKKLEKDIFEKEGKFNHIKNDEEIKKSFEEFFKSAGVYRDWPDNRLIYFNDYSRFLCIINEEDHLKLRLNSVNPIDMQRIIQNYFEFLEKIENSLDFSMHKQYGFLNSLPSNLGTGTYFRLKIKISSDDKKNEILLNKFEESKKEILLEIKKEETQTYLIISNTNPFYTFSTLLVEILGVKDYFK